LFVRGSFIHNNVYLVNLFNKLINKLGYQVTIKFVNQSLCIIKEFVIIQ
jgi:hypothetical protein